MKCSTDVRTTSTTPSSSTTFEDPAQVMCQTTKTSTSLRRHRAPNLTHLSAQHGEEGTVVGMWLQHGAQVTARPLAPTVPVAPTLRIFLSTTLLAMRARYLPARQADTLPVTTARERASE